MTDEIPEAPEGWPAADPATVERARTDGGTRALIARAMWRRDYQPGPEAQRGGFVYEVADRIAELAVPEIERQVREQIAADIYADQNRGRVVALYERCIRVALGRDPEGWPNDEREVNDILARIRGESR